MSVGISLHVGVNQLDRDHYGHLEPLRGAERDAQAMAQLARSTGFTPRTVLLGPRATLESVRAAVTDAATQLRRGDMFLFSFAGRGGAVPDRRDRDSEAQAETFCLHDQPYLLELLRADLRGFRAEVRIVIVSDSCRAGTAARAAIYEALRHTPRLSPMLGEGAARALPPELASGLFLTHRETYEAWHAGIPAEARAPLGPTVLRLAACQELQEAKDGPLYGKFTAALLTVWNGGKYLDGERPSYEDLVARVGEVLGDPTQVPDLVSWGERGADLRACPPFVLDQA